MEPEGALPHSQVLKEFPAQDEFLYTCHKFINFLLNGVYSHAVGVSQKVTP